MIFNYMFKALCIIMILSLTFNVYSIVSLSFLSRKSSDSEADKTYDTIMSVRDAVTDRSNWSFRISISLTVVGLLSFIAVVFESLTTREASLRLGPFL